MSLRSRSSIDASCAIGRHWPSLRRRDRRALAGRVRRGPPARRASTGRCSTTRSATSSAPPYKQVSALRGAQARRRAGGAQHRRPRRDAGLRRQAARLAAAGLLLARRPALGQPGLVLVADRLSHRRSCEGGYKAFRARVRARAARRCRQAFDLRRAGRPHRQRQDAAAAAPGRGRRAGARPRRPGLPPRLGARRVCPASRSRRRRTSTPASGRRCAASTPARPVYVESESARIGSLRVPEPLLLRMRTTAACVRHRRCPTAGARRPAAARTTPSSPTTSKASAGCSTPWSNCRAASG